jgi:hypothetical protein
MRELTIKLFKQINAQAIKKRENFSNLLKIEK